MKRRILAVALFAANFWSLAVGHAFAQAGEMANYYYMVFSAPSPGQEAEYNRWYDNQHLQDVTSVPGFTRGERFVLNDPQMYAGVAVAMPKYLAVYTIQTADIDGVMKEINRRLAVRETVLSPAFDRSSAVSYIYRFSRPEQRPVTQNLLANTPGNRVQYFHVVFTVPQEAKKDVFDKWYDEVHAPSMLRGPGYLSAQRLVLARPAQGKIAPTDAIATFRLDLPESTPVTAAREKPLPGTVLGNDSLDLSRNRGYTYRQIGPVVVGDTVRATRAAKPGERPAAEQR